MDDNQNTQINIPSQQNDGFHSKLGFILSAAGAAVGLGSIWRFPYLAAQNGGGLFLIVYIVFAVTIGFSLTKMEIAVGRKTGKNVLDAYGAVNKKFSWVGILGIICPLIVLPYYCVIGGWVTKYMFSYADIINAAQKIGSNPDYFSQFTSGTWQPIVFFAVFTICTAAVIILGVGKGIEKLSIILMPILMVLCLGLAIYVVCQPNALQGLKFYLVPNAKGMSFGDVLNVFSSALSQLFFPCDGRYDDLRLVYEKRNVHFFLCAVDRRVCNFCRVYCRNDNNSVNLRLFLRPRRGAVCRRLYPYV